MDTYYDTLEVSETASEVVIKAAYKYLSQRNHPDRGGDPERQKALNEAYRILSDPEERALYDEWLAAERTCIDLEEDIVQRMQDEEWPAGEEPESEDWEANSRPVKKRGRPWWLRVVAGLVASFLAILWINHPWRSAGILEDPVPFLLALTSLWLLHYALSLDLLSRDAERRIGRVAVGVLLAFISFLLLQNGPSSVFGVASTAAFALGGAALIYSGFYGPRTSKKHGVRKT